MNSENRKEHLNNNVQAHSGFPCAKPMATLWISFLDWIPRLRMIVPWGFLGFQSNNLNHQSAFGWRPRCSDQLEHQFLSVAANHLAHSNLRRTVKGGEDEAEETAENSRNR